MFQQGALVLGSEVTRLAAELWQLPTLESLVPQQALLPAIAAGTHITAVLCRKHKMC